MSAPEDKPLIRVAICGEVRAGKSAMLNALFGKNILPDNLGNDIRPTVFIGYNREPDIELFDVDGNSFNAAEIKKEDIPKNIDTIQVWHDREYLSNFEFIEVPMTNAEDLTEKQIGLIRSADIMIWVTIASQAWRLTEKKIVEELGNDKPEHCILSVSRADKLRSFKDLKKIESRVERETTAFFQKLVFMKNSKRLIELSAKSAKDRIKTGAAEIVSTLNEFSEEIYRKQLAEPDPVTEDREPQQVAQVVPDDAVDVEAAADAVTPAPVNNSPAIAQFVQAMRDDVIVGLYGMAGPEQCEVLQGEPEYCRTVGETCHALQSIWLNAYGDKAARDPEFSMSILTRTHSLLYRSEAGDNSLFMLSDKTALSYGIAQNKFAQLSKIVACPA